MKGLDAIKSGDHLFIFCPDGGEYVEDFQGLIEYCREHEVSPRHLQIASAKLCDADDLYRIFLTEDDISDIERDACIT